MSEKNWQKKGESFILFFFLIIPFAYAFQVIFKRPLIAIIPYLSLFIGLLLIYAGSQKNCIKNLYGDNLNFIFLSFSLILLHHTIYAAISISNGDFKYGLRALILFTLPLLIFYFVPALSKSFLISIINVLVLFGGILVGLEMLYETYSHHILTRPTIFQLMNKDYVFSQIGLQLTQLFGINYRPPGLLEHVHALTTFMACAAIANMVFYLFLGRWYYLLGFIVCITALVTHGVRLPLFSFSSVFVTLTLVIFRFSGPGYSRKRMFEIFLIIIFVIMCQLFWDPFGTAKIYYWPAILRGDLQQGDVPITDFIFNNVDSRIIEFGNKLDMDFYLSLNDIEPLLGLILGYGIVGSLRGFWGFNDDIFLFSLLAQYGPIIFIVFISLWIYTMFSGIFILLKRRNLDVFDKSLLCFAVGVLIILAFSMFHSSTLQRKSIFPFFPLAVGIVWRYQKITAAPRNLRSDLMA